MTKNQHDILLYTIKELKQIVVKSQSYEIEANIRDIERHLTFNSDEKNLIEYINWINESVSDFENKNEASTILNNLKSLLREELINKLLENDTERI